MGTPRIRPLTAAALATIEDPCAGCGHGSSRPQTYRRSDRKHRRAGDRGFGAATGYLDEVTDLWGLCGVAAHRDGQVPGYACFAPAELVPPIPLAAVGTPAEIFDSEAAVLTAVAVCRGHRGQGLGRDLVRAALGQLVRHQVGMVEVLATPGPTATRADSVGRLDSGGAGRHPLIILPVGFWTAVGFRVVRPHPVAPILRLDVAATVRRLPDFTAAWQRFARLVSQPGPAQPAGFSDPGLNRSGLNRSGKAPDPAARPGPQSTGERDRTQLVGNDGKRLPRPAVIA